MKAGEIFGEAKIRQERGHGAAVDVQPFLRDTRKLDA